MVGRHRALCEAKQGVLCGNDKTKHGKWKWRAEQHEMSHSDNDQIKLGVDAVWATERGDEQCDKVHV